MKCLLVTADSLPLLTFHQFFSTSSTPGVVLIILLAGGEQTGVYVLPRSHNLSLQWRAVDEYVPGGNPQVGPQG